MPREAPRSGSCTLARTVKKRTNKQAVAPPKPISAADRAARQLELAAQEPPSKVNNLSLALERPDHPSRREPLRLAMKDELEEFKRTNEEIGETWYAIHPYGVDAQFRRKVYSTMREVHTFRKLNPIDAERIRDGNKLVYWQAYAENNDQAKYYSILVGDGYPGRLCIVGPKIFWEPIMSDEKFAGYQANARPRVELQFNKHSKFFPLIP
ncbi:hypothetical protein BDV97DRAFT_24617 [Delphinella strobiligena]|nr:hypothetical protein BDV97DRAFT_24617 [Delphinella strobiligena]